MENMQSHSAQLRDLAVATISISRVSGQVKFRYSTAHFGIVRFSPSAQLTAVTCATLTSAQQA
jgi:hypothetical protein